MRLSVLLVAATIASTSLALTQAPAHAADPKFDALVQLIERKMTQYSVPGVAFGVVKDGVTRARGLGITNLDNPQAVSADTVFALAGC